MEISLLYILQVLAQFDHNFRQIRTAFTES